MTVIREAAAADLPAIQAMAVAFHGTSRYGQVLPVPAASHLGALLAHLETEGCGVVLVAEDAGALVGMLVLLVGVHPLSGETVADELAWWVAPAKRTGRVGLQLLKAAEVWATAYGVVWLTLAEPLPLDAVGRYARLGYAALEVRWIKRLAPAAVPVEASA